MGWVRLIPMSTEYDVNVIKTTKTTTEFPNGVDITSTSTSVTDWMPSWYNQDDMKVTKTMTTKEVSVNTGVKSDLSGDEVDEEGME